MPFGQDDLKRAVDATEPPLGAYSAISKAGNLVGEKSRPSAGRPGDVGALPYLALAAGNGLDAGSSAYNFSRGYQEQNPMYSWMGPQPTAGIAALKGLQTALMAYGMRKMNNDGHPTAAKVLGYLGGAMGAIPAAYNFTRPNLKK